MFEMIGITVITGGGDPAYADAFNYFFSLVANMGFIFVVPYTVLRIVGKWC